LQLRIIAIKGALIWNPALKQMHSLNKIPNYLGLALAALLFFDGKLRFFLLSTCPQ